MHIILRIQVADTRRTSLTSLLAFMKTTAPHVCKTQGGFGGGVQEQSRLISYIAQSQREGLVEMFAKAYTVDREIFVLKIFRARHFSRITFS